MQRTWRRLIKSREEADPRVVSKKDAHFTDILSSVLAVVEHNEQNPSEYQYGLVSATLQVQRPGNATFQQLQRYLAAMIEKDLNYMERKPESTIATILQCGLHHFELLDIGLSMSSLTCPTNVSATTCRELGIVLQDQSLRRQAAGSMVQRPEKNTSYTLADSTDLRGPSQSSQS